MEDQDLSTLTDTCDFSSKGSEVCSWSLREGARTHARTHELLKVCLPPPLYFLACVLNGLSRNPRTSPDGTRILNLTVEDSVRSRASLTQAAEGVRVTVGPELSIVTVLPKQGKVFPLKRSHSSSLWQTM